MVNSTLPADKPDEQDVFADHFIQLRWWFVAISYTMFATYFMKSLSLLRKYRKEFSIYSFIIIFVTNLGFLGRATLYNVSRDKYS